MDLPKLPAIRKLARDLVVLAAIYGSLVFVMSIMRGVSLDNERLESQNAALNRAVASYGKRINVLKDSLESRRIVARTSAVVVDHRIAAVRAAAGDSVATVVQLDTLEVEHQLEVARYESALAVDDSIIAYQDSTIVALYGVIRNKDTLNDQLHAAVVAQVSQNRKMKIGIAAVALLVLVTR